METLVDGISRNMEIEMEMLFVKNVKETLCSRRRLLKEYPNILSYIMFATTVTRAFLFARRRAVEEYSG